MASRTADIILITKKLRVEWMDTMALDRDLPPMAFRVAGIIGYHFNKNSGETFLRQDTIARLAGKSERTVWTAIQQLEARGYLLIDRRDLGFRAKDGRRVCGGRGVANTYQPAFERSQLTATSSGTKLAERCDLISKERSQKKVRKVEADCVPTLTPPTVEYPGDQKLLDQLHRTIGDRAWQRLSVGLEMTRSPSPALIFKYRWQRDELLSMLQGSGSALFPGFAFIAQRGAA